MLDSWEYDVLGIYNPNRIGPLYFWYEFLINEAPKIDGGVLEAGVWRGRSLLTSALTLAEVAPEKKIFGFDSYQGFPTQLDARDEPSAFKLQYEKGLITENHYSRVIKNLYHLGFLKGEFITSRNVSSSGDFSGTSATQVMSKADYLGLANIELVEGEFSNTMKGKFPEKLCAVMLDCDLYSSYETALEFTWSSLSGGGMIYLDEYYSLKFPGARTAVLDFLRGKDAEVHSRIDEFNGFERCWIIKP